MSMALQAHCRILIYSVGTLERHCRYTAESKVLTHFCLFELSFLSHFLSQQLGQFGAKKLSLSTLSCILHILQRINNVSPVSVDEG